jgi:hypothetical protein
MRYDFAFSVDDSYITQKSYGIGFRTAYDIPKTIGLSKLFDCVEGITVS